MSAAFERYPFGISKLLENEFPAPSVDLHPEITAAVFEVDPSKSWIWECTEPPNAVRTEQVIENPKRTNECPFFGVQIV